MVAQQQPQQVHALQCKAVIAIGQPGDERPRHAEEYLGIEHIAQLERESHKVIFQRRIIADGCSLRGICNIERVAVPRRAQLDRGDESRAEYKCPAQQRNLQPPQLYLHAVPVEDIQRRKEDEHEYQVQENIVRIYLGILSRRIGNAYICRLYEGRPCQIYHEKHCQNKYDCRAQLFDARRISVQSPVLHVRPPVCLFKDKIILSHIVRQFNFFLPGLPGRKVRMRILSLSPPRRG